MGGREKVRRSGLVECPIVGVVADFCISGNGFGAVAVDEIDDVAEVLLEPVENFGERVGAVWGDLDPVGVGVDEVAGEAGEVGVEGCGAEWCVEEWRASGAGAVEGEMDSGFLEAFADDVMLEVVEAGLFSFEDDVVAAEEGVSPEGVSAADAFDGVVGEDVVEDPGVVGVEEEGEAVLAGS